MLLTKKPWHFDQQKAVFLSFAVKKWGLAPQVGIAI
jgi:hypothetical protein